MIHKRFKIDINSWIENKFGSRLMGVQGRGVSIYGHTQQDANTQDKD
jgi:hypothetical protein